MIVIDWNILITAIAGFIAVQVPIIIGIIRVIVDGKYQRKRQYHMINQNNRVLGEKPEHPAGPGDGAD